MKEIIKITENNYGKINVNLKSFLEKSDISMSKLAKISGVDYRVIKRMCDNTLTRLDLDILCRICYVLECEISDILLLNSSNM